MNRPRDRIAYLWANIQFLWDVHGKYVFGYMGYVLMYILPIVNWVTVIFIWVYILSSR